jgi:hypothetical protein
MCVGYFGCGGEVGGAVVYTEVGHRTGSGSMSSAARSRPISRLTWLIHDWALACTDSMRADPSKSLTPLG